MSQWRDQLVEKIKKQVDAWNNELDQLMVQARQSNSQVRRRYEEAAKDLRHQRDKLEGRLEKLRTSAESTWDDFKRELDHASREMGRSVDSLREDFQEVIGQPAKEEEEATTDEIPAMPEKKEHTLAPQTDPGPRTRTEEPRVPEVTERPTHTKFA